jgi:GT2 family glycosyltransferase
MIYIIMPVFNRIGFTLACLESLSRQTFGNFEVIVVNDGSTDETSEILRAKFPMVKVLEGNGTLWWTGSTNLGIEHVLDQPANQDDFILTLNNDLVVNENYLQEMVNAAARFPRTIIGSLSMNINKPSSIHYAGTRWNSRTATYRPATDRNIPLTELQKNNNLLSTDLLPGRGTLIPIRVFKEIGLYDQINFPQYMGDEDFALRAKKAGYKLGVSPLAIVYSHIGETGLGSRKKSFRYYIDYYTSLRSHANVSRRWKWAKRHANVSPYLYFSLDFARITMSLLIKY